MAFAVKRAMLRQPDRLVRFRQQRRSGVVTDNSGNGHTGTIDGSAAVRDAKRRRPVIPYRGDDLQRRQRRGEPEYRRDCKPIYRVDSAGTNAVTVSFWEYGDSTQPDAQYGFLRQRDRGRRFRATTRGVMASFISTRRVLRHQRLTSRAVPSDYRPVESVYATKTPGQGFT